MEWDYEEEFYKFSFMVGPNGKENFQICRGRAQGGQWRARGKTRTIGPEPEGSCWTIRMFLKQGGSAKKVDWVKADDAVARRLESMAKPMIVPLEKIAAGMGSGGGTADERQAHLTGFLQTACLSWSGTQVTTALDKLHMIGIFTLS